VAGAAGIVALATTLLFLGSGQPWGTIAYVALTIMTGAIPFVMLAFWELGGLTPTPLARLAQVTGWVAAGVWCVTSLLSLLGVMDVDTTVPATGAYAIQSVALIVIGLWIAGANLLAGPWLNALRWVGVASGLGVAVFAAGTLLTDKDSALIYAGAIWYLPMLPLWALGMALYLARAKSAITAQ
jgi:hypothetical protein